MATRNDQPDEGPLGSPEKDPDEWVTGDEPMTGAQASYLHTLARQAGETVEDDLTKAEASRRIDELQASTGRGAAKQPDEPAEEHHGRT